MLVLAWSVKHRVAYATTPELRPLVVGRHRGVRPFVEAPGDTVSVWGNVTPPYACGMPLPRRTPHGARTFWPIGAYILGESARVFRYQDAKPIGGTAIMKWFKKAEQLAKIRHIRGRGAYGLRRVAVDAAKERHISREGLKAFGGWTDTQIPDMVYAETDAHHARAEAAEIRSQMRGES